jgi:Trypsin-co-occurring domain 1
MADATPDEVLVQVIQLEPGREIGWGSGVTEKLRDHLDDLSAAIRAGSAAVAGSLDSLATRPGWHLTEVSASFGVTLTGEAGILVSHASVGATFDVTVRFTRAEESQHRA